MAALGGQCWELRGFACVLSCSNRVQLFASPWTVARQAPLPMEFSRQEYRSGEPFRSLGNLPDQGTEHRSLALQVDSLPSEPPGNLIHRGSYNLLKD